jgi:hypothetical protein
MCGVQEERRRKGEGKEKKERKEGNQLRTPKKKPTHKACCPLDQLNS